MAGSLDKKSPDEKITAVRNGNLEEDDIDNAEALHSTPIDLQKTLKHVEELSLSEVKALLEQTLDIHEFDPNFPTDILEKIKHFVQDPDVFDNPQSHVHIIQEMKLEAALIVNDSPYVEVRAVVDNTDDEEIPCSTIRVWVIGGIFVIILSVINQLFSIRKPSITVGAAVAQLLAYPVGKAAEKYLPDIGFTCLGVRHSLNPGKFSKKEHMLITIMANVGHSRPSSNYIIWVQFLKQYFNQSYSGQFGYQILLALSTDFMGYGLAGLCRKFLVYPSYCLFPHSLVTIALNNSLHSEGDSPVLGPFKKNFSLSRYKLFIYSFIGMFVYFWFPDTIFGALSVFNWLAWIAPNNVNLAVITGINNGMGFNPLPTFDWNMITADLDPLVVPFTTTINQFIGVVIGGIIIAALWYTNTFHTSYLPINSNTLYNHFGTSYNVSKVLNSKVQLDENKYQAYSPAFFTASSITMYFFFFASYAATVSYVFLHHRRAILLGFCNFWKGLKEPTGQFKDIHIKLISAYREVPEWWYFIVNVFAIVLGIGAIKGWDTNTTVGVPFFGILMAVIFLVPIGVIYAMTGVEIELNVLAEFIGGALQPGNALAMMFFKVYGYTTTAHALTFVSDLKLAHYTKIPPRHTFYAQLIATFISSFICTALLNYQIRDIPNVCQTGQKDRFTCPGVNTYFSAAVIFGSIGARKVFGAGGQYTSLLVAFPIGFVLPIAFFYLQRKLPVTHWFRKLNPVLLLSGGMNWSPYNVSYIWPAVPVGWLSMVYLKQRYLEFWSKYNYVLSAAFSTAIAVAAVVIYFAISVPNVSIDWWGNNADTGCESTSCRRLSLTGTDYFGPRVGHYN